MKKIFYILVCLLGVIGCNNEPPASVRTESQAVTPEKTTRSLPKRTNRIDPMELSMPSQREREPIIPLPPLLDNDIVVVPEPVSPVEPEKTPQIQPVQPIIVEQIEKEESDNYDDSPDYFNEPTLAPPKNGASAEAPFFRAQAKTAYAASSSEPFDPIKQNGRYFVDWPVPKLAIVFTGQQEGYLEPCGCAGMNQMKGGLSRRLTFLRELEAKNWPLVAVDSGNLCNSFGRQAELKFHLSVDALRTMKYDAIGIGKSELRFSVDDLLSETFNMPDNPSLFTSANVAMMQFDPTMTAPYKIIKRGDLKVGVVSVVANSVRSNINNPGVVSEDAAKKIKEILPKLIAEQANILVLLVDGTSQEAESLGKQFPDFRVVVPSETPSDPPRMSPKLVNNSQYMIEVGEKAKFAVVLGIFDDAEFPVRYQRVALDSRFDNSPIIIKSMELYQDQLKSEGFAGLGIKTIADGRSEQLGGFVGSKACETCHEEEYKIWKNSKHAAAWHSLTDISKPARHYDPECIVCHVVGWDISGRLPYRGGYLNEEKTPHLENVGCESCHGPGERHCKLEQPGGGSKAEIEAVRKAINPEIEEAKKICIECHDLDNSPAFDFDTYWPKVNHNAE